MNRRTFIGAAGGALALPAQRPPRSPNIILMVSDDHGYADLGCQGATDLLTPHIDALASSGTRFTQWYSNAPMCAPARAGLLTGRWPARAGVPQNGLPLPPEQKTLATLLKGAGYSTGLIGKWHLGNQHMSSPASHGFDRFFGFHSGCVDYYSHRYYWGEPRVPNYHDLWSDGKEVFRDGEYLTEAITREAVNFVDQNRTHPFFLYLAFNAPHYPMHAPAKYLARFPKLDPERRTYAAMIAAMDDGVGEITAALRRHGLERDTIILFAGDNGATREARAGLNGRPATAGSSGPLRGFKFSAFDGGVRVPAILTWPGVVPSKAVSAQVAAHFDFVPTVLEAARVTPPAGHTFDGMSLLRPIRSASPINRPPLYWASQRQTAVRSGNWKLVVNGLVADGTPEGSKPLTGEDAVFLSRIDTDPGETHNLRRNEPKLVDELQSGIAAWQASLGQR